MNRQTIPQVLTTALAASGMMPGILNGSRSCDTRARAVVMAGPYVGFVPDSCRDGLVGTKLPEELVNQV